MKKIIYLLLTACCLLLAISCRQQKEIQYIDRVSYIDRLKVDSVYLSKTDSIYIEKRNDTVFIEKYRTLFRDKYRIEKDTVIKRDSLIFKSVETKTVKVPAKITIVQKFQILCGNILIVLLTLATLYYIVKYLIKTKLN